MKKEIALLTCLILVSTYTVDQFHHLTQKQKKHTQITPADVHNNHKMMFKKGYKHFVIAYKDFKAELDGFFKEVKKYNNQTINHQKKYANFDKIIQALHRIHQKHLVIGISKILQYKKGAQGTEDLAKAEEQLTTLKSYIAEIESYLGTMTLKKEFLETYFTPKELSRAMPIAQHFKNLLSEEFFFKIKKAKRALTNWSSKLFTYSPGTSPATK